jgi:hypothetical protein
MEQILARLMAEMNAMEERMEAQIGAEIRANQERMEAKMDASQGKIGAWLEEMKSGGKRDGLQRNDGGLPGE